MICLNLFQTWQYKNGLIHYDDMSKEAYFKGFFQTKLNSEWLDLLKPYDWERRIDGEAQIEYSSEYFNSINKKKGVYLRGSNLLYVAVNEKAQNAMGSLSKEQNANGLFFVEHLDDKTICIRSYSGLAWSLKSQFENVITASETNIGSTETFTFEYIDDDDDRIAIKAANGIYISIGS